MGNSDDYVFLMQRIHVIMEMHGDQRRDRPLPLSIGGEPVIVDTNFDGTFARIKGNPLVLPRRMVEPIRLLKAQQELWLDRLGKSPWRTSHVIAAELAVERIVRHFMPNASVCRGSSYLLKRIVIELGHAAHSIAVDQRSSAALAADEHMAEASARIKVLIASANCQAA